MPLSIFAAPTFDQHYSEHFDDFSIELLLTGFGPSWGLEYLPGNQLLITEWKSGDLYVADLNDSKVHLLAQVDDVYSAGQGGLMAVMADQHFSQNQRLYFTRSFLRGSKSTTQLLTAVIETIPAQEQKSTGFSFWRKEAVPYRLSQPQLLFSADPWVNSSKHYGAALAQDEEGAIYLSVGDRGQRQEAQNVKSQLGKIIKLDLAVSDNMKSVKLNSASIYSLGHRNPQGLIYHKPSQRLWSSEHGPKGGDEVNLIQAGHNYGWPLLTDGEEYLGGKIAVAHQLPGMTQPLISYVPSIATSALLYYADKQAGERFMPALDKSFLLLSLKAKEIHLLVEGEGRLESRGLLLENIHERWRNAVASPSGEVFLLAESGKIYRLSQGNQ